MTLSKKELGTLIKEARKLKSTEINKPYTQRMLANDLNKSQSCIGDIESGRTYPSYVLLNKIANACGVSISFFDIYNSLNDDIDEFIKLQLPDIKEDDLESIRKELKNDPDAKLNYIYEYIEKKKNSSKISFKTPEETISFILKQPTMIEHLGIDISKLDNSTVSELTDDIINQIKLISYKYKK